MLKPMNKLQQAYEIALKADVSSAADSVVLYSVSYLPTNENKINALEYVKEHKGCITIDNTLCGKLLLKLGLGPDSKFSQEDLMKVWAIASERFIMKASGNVTAFVENADPRSIFRKIELPCLLKNERIALINGIDKFVFATKFN